MRTSLDYLFRIESPWISVGFGEHERKNWIPSHFYAREGKDVCVRRLRGRKIETKTDLMNEFGAAFQFFDGFGENWHALFDCLSCLDEWLPAQSYVLVIEDAEAMLRRESSEQISALLRTLHDIGEWWSKPIVDNDRFSRDALPFHSLLNVSIGEQRAIDRFASIANDADVPVRR